MKCPGCGSESASTQRFCHRCGFALDRVYAELHEDATMEMSHDALEQELAARAAQSRRGDAVEKLAKALEATIAEYLERHPDTTAEQVGAALGLVAERDGRGRT